jgi:hypothetical protein
VRAGASRSGQIRQRIAGGRPGGSVEEIFRDVLDMEPPIERY